jgi:toxin-antitoxin system PIN domain toxin
MRALLDVNVLIALLDSDHAMHARATGWLAANVRAGWASCPITQNGCIRIMSHPSYPNALSVSAIVERLGEAVATAHHRFWPDDFSILDAGIGDPTRVHGPRQVTDAYLFALAVRNRGRFVSFDAGIPLAAVQGAERKHLVGL